MGSDRARVRRRAAHEQTTTYGVGTVSYPSGTVAVTLGALPDVGSEIVYAWGGKANCFNRATSTIAPPTVALQLSNAGVTPFSAQNSWRDGTARTACG
jgi:hypothetical protein